MARQARVGECSCGYSEGVQEYEWVECSVCGFPCLLLVTHGWPHKVRGAARVLGGRAGFPDVRGGWAGVDGGAFQALLNERQDDAAST